MDNKKLRIAMILPDLNFGGAQTMVLRLINTVDKDKFDIRLFIRDSKLGNPLEKEAEEKGIECVFLDIGENEKHGNVLLHKVKAYSILSKALKSYGPDLVHSHLEQFYSFLFCILNRVPLIHTLHSMPERIYTKRLHFMVKRLENNKKLMIVGCSKKTSQQTQKLFHLKESSITTIYNPIHLDDYKPEEKKTSEFIFIHVARLHPVKNQVLLLHAFGRIKEDNVKLWVVGDGGTREQLESLTKELDIDRKVIFMGSRSDVPMLLSKADAFVLSSNSEACPMTVLEALASGLPVVSTDVGGIKELIGECGILVEAKNEDKLFEAMMEIQKPEVYLKMGNKIARQRATLFSDVVIAGQYEKLYGNMNGK